MPGRTAPASAAGRMTEFAPSCFVLIYPWRLIGQMVNELQRNGRRGQPIFGWVSVRFGGSDEHRHFQVRNRSRLRLKQLDKLLGRFAELAVTAVNDPQRPHERDFLDGDLNECAG